MCWEAYADIEPLTDSNPLAFAKNIEPLTGQHSLLIDDVGVAGQLLPAACVLHPHRRKPQMRRLPRIRHLPCPHHRLAARYNSGVPKRPNVLDLSIIRLEGQHV